MSVSVRVQGGTNAGWRKIITAGVAKCECGRFISCSRAAEGATRCLRCTDEQT